MYGKSVPEGVQGNANVTIRVTGSPSYTVIAFSYLLIIVYALTLAPVCWVYAAEVWSLETRGKGMGYVRLLPNSPVPTSAYTPNRIAATGNWLFNFALGLFVPPAFKNISWKTFIVFGTLCLGAAVQFFFSYPETGRKTLEEIEIMFRPGGPKPWKTKMGESVLDERAASVVAETQGSLAEEGKVQVVREDGRVEMVGRGDDEKDEKEKWSS